MANAVKTRVPQYQAVAATLRREIAGLPPNSLLPTELQLAKRFGISRVTLREALVLLEQGGLVSRHRGRGTIISPPKITRRFSPLYSFEQDLTEQGVEFETQVLSYEPEATPPEFIRERLRLPPGSAAGFLSLVRRVDSRIVCHDGRHYPPAIAARLRPERIEGRDASRVLEDLVGMRITAVDWESEIIPSSMETAAVLELSPGTLILANTFTYHVESGAPIEAGVISYRIDRCKFRYELPFSQHAEAEPPVPDAGRDSAAVTRGR
ncbi:MAG: GntR family transcriptional regulator [Kiloniellales bacterium]